MAHLPLETHTPAALSAQKQSRGPQDGASCLISASLLLGVLVSDTLVLSHLICVSVFMLILVVLVTRKQGHRFLLWFVLIAFIAGGAASYAERWRNDTSPIQSSTAGLTKAVILKSEVQEKGRARLWLTNITQHGTDVPQEITGIIRVTIDNLGDQTVIQGDHFEGYLRLFPLSGPLFPDWPDYARKSWSEGIVGTGYGRAPLISSAQSSEAFKGGSVIATLRSHISQAFKQDLTHGNLTLARALFIGERDFSDRSFYTPFRQAGLAHLLAISGLHMGLFCFGIYGVMRFILCLPVTLSGRIGHHKIAGVIALFSGLFYLFLAGTPISAIRAYLMAVIILTAVLGDRRTVTIRNLNIVFILFLLLYPSALYQPAFQLSFAATYGIVLFHNHNRLKRDNRQIAAWKWIGRLYYLIATSFMAIAASFLIVAYHFGTVSPWGILSNIFAIPYTALVIMPLGISYLISLLFSSTSLIAPAFNLGLSGLILFANFMSALPFSSLSLPMPPAIYLPLYAIAAVLAIYMRPLWRVPVVIAAITGVMFWAGQVRPIGALTTNSAGEGAFMRLAILDDGTLYHTHRLSRFWQESYAKLLGTYNASIYLSCRDDCEMTTSTGDRLLISKTEKKIACSRYDIIFTASLSEICDTTSYKSQDADSPQVRILRLTSHTHLLYHNPKIGYYLTKSRQAPPQAIWRSR